MLDIETSHDDQSHVVWLIVGFVERSNSFGIDSISARLRIAIPTAVDPALPTSRIRASSSGGTDHCSVPATTFRRSQKRETDAALLNLEMPHAHGDEVLTTRRETRARNKSRSLSSVHEKAANSSSAWLTSERPRTSPSRSSSMTGTSNSLALSPSSPGQFGVLSNHLGR